MTESQYDRANKKVYPVVLTQLIIMVVMTIIGFVSGISIQGIIMVIAAIGGIFVLGYLMKAEMPGKKRAIGLLGTASVVYFVFLLLNFSATVYAYAMPLMTASIIYLNVRFLYYGGTITIVGNILHLIIMTVAGHSGKIDMLFNFVIIAIVIYIVYNVSITLTAFNEENLQVQKEASDKMLLVADNLIKHFDTVKEKMYILSDVIKSNSESMTNIADSTGSTAEAIQEQAMMCSQIQNNTDEAERETAEMLEKSKHTMENVAQGAKLIAGLKEQAANVENASNLAAESTKQVNRRVEEVKGIVATILSISSQTNLLALNASIEAARAGEAGKGFSVVADEIRQLSEQTKEATNKITDIIKDLNADAEKAVESMEHSAGSIKEQSEMIDTTKDKFESIDAEMKSLTEVIASMEGAITAILQSTNTISENISNLSATSQEIAASSTEGQQTAQRTVQDMSEVFQVITATYILAQDLKNSAEQ